MTKGHSREASPNSLSVQTNKSFKLFSPVDSKPWRRRLRCLHPGIILSLLYSLYLCSTPPFLALWRSVPYSHFYLLPPSKENVMLLREFCLTVSSLVSSARNPFLMWTLKTAATTSTPEQLCQDYRSVSQQPH